MSLQVAPTLPPPRGTIGGRIKQARQYQGLSQDQLIAELDRLGVDAPSRRTLSTWENDKGDGPSVRTLLRIAAATRFPIAWFVIDLTDEPGPSDDEPGPGVEYAPRDSNPEPADSPVVVPLRARPAPTRHVGPAAA